MSPLTNSYNIPHAPFGAFSAFTCGYATSWEGERAPHSGGFSPSTRHPANQNLFFGWRRGDGEWAMLPFMQPRADRSADFTAEEGIALQDTDRRVSERQRTVPPEELQRRLGLASDIFSSGPVEIAFYSPFEAVREWTALPADRQKLLCAPVVPVLCTVDNSKGDKPVQLMFGFGDRERGLRVLGDTHPELVGFASATFYGFAARPHPRLSVRSGFDLFSHWRRDHRHVHLLGAEAAIVLEVPPGESIQLPVAMGFYQQGTITTGIPASFYYTRFFRDLEDVLDFGLGAHAELRGIADARDRELAAAPVPAMQKWSIAQAVHTYLTSTELLQQEGRPLWVVNEGEYRMMNTFDLTVDHLFFELEWWPWSVRDTLDLFVSRYSYRDTLHDTAGNTAPGGLSFTHDMGVDNQFTPPGYSSYELPNLRDCFSYMTSEQLVNWICCAVTYALHTDDIAWLAGKRDTLLACAESLHRRDDPDPAHRIGIIRWDSDRCGTGGSEITTYDSLDISLGQARNNLYLAVKTMAAWSLLARGFERIGERAGSADCAQTACLAARSIAGFQERDTGMFPAVFEAGNKSRIIPAVEGFAFLLYLGLNDEIARLEAASGIVTALGTHLKRALVRGVCLDAASGGWKLSSTSTNTWVSKIYLSQYVVQRLYPELLSGEAGAPAQAVHMAWLLSPSTRPLAYCDQLRSTDGFPFGSKHYPRGVTSWLFVSKAANPTPAACPA